MDLLLREAISNNVTKNVLSNGTNNVVKEKVIGLHAMLPIGDANMDILGTNEMT